MKNSSVYQIFLNKWNTGQLVGLLGIQGHGHTGQTAPDKKDEDPVSVTYCPATSCPHSPRLAAPILLFAQESVDMQLGHISERTSARLHRRWAGSLGLRHWGSSRHSGAAGPCPTASPLQECTRTPLLTWRLAGCPLQGLWLPQHHSCHTASHQASPGWQGRGGRPPSRWVDSMSTQGQEGLWVTIFAGCLSPAPLLEVKRKKTKDGQN